jgi:hypothetical protein
MLGTAYVPHGLVDRVWRHQPDWRFQELKCILKPTLVNPVSMFKVLREHGDGWFAYVGRPVDAYEGFRNAHRVDPDEDEVFVVTVSDRMEVYNFAWVKCDPSDPNVPVDHGNRYEGRVF